MRQESLAELFLVDERSDEPWSGSDLRSMMAHQMRVPLVVDLSSASSLDPGADDEGVSGVGITSFGDLFAHEQPPIELLRLTKRFARGSIDGRQPSMPQEIAYVLYYLSIATAHVRLGESISSLSNDQLARGLQWCLDRPWLSGEARERLGACLAML